MTNDEIINKLNEYYKELKKADYSYYSLMTKGLPRISEKSIMLLKINTYGLGMEGKNDK